MIPFPGAVMPASNTVQNGTDLGAGVALPFRSESKGTNPETIVFRPLSYVWCRCRGTL
jgi:hypothetical protein